MNKRAVIVEDEFFVANHLKKILIDYGYTVVAQYHDGETVLKDLPILKDVIFLLDIQLSTKINGVSIAKELDKHKIPFIFITANAEDETFKKAITSNPVTYISKPFKELDILAGISLASQKLTKKICIESGKGKFYINPDDVLYLKSDHVYVDIYMADNHYSIRTQLKKLENELDHNFCRSHKSYIVNKNKITSIKGNFIYIDKIEIPLSKTYLSNF